MKIKKESDIRKIIQEEILLEMAASIRQKRTGLPMIIWISDKSGAEMHSCRIKVQNTYSQKLNRNNLVSITVEDNPRIVAGEGLSNKDFELIKKFIFLNKNILLKHWNDKTSTDELLDNIKPIKNIKLK